MREIKFRAWSEKYKKVFRVKDISFDRDGYIHGLIDNETVDEHRPTQEEFQNHPYVWIGRVDFTKSLDGRTSGLFQNPNEDAFLLMQYTGLKDKNGVNIYEGDVVECFSSGLSVVKFRNGSFGLMNDIAGFVPFSEIHGEMEVIGNIYDNPDLLESEPNET